jgi:hypothetical protein
VNGSDVTRSDVSHMTGSHRKWRDRKYVLCIAGFFPRFFLTIIVVKNVVQVPWLPDVTWPRRGFPWVCTCATGSCTISALVGTFHWKWRHQTSPEGIPLEGCVHAQPEVVQYPIKRHKEGFPRKICERACVIGSALGVLSMTSGSYYRFLALSLVICPFPTILFSWGVLSIITFLTKACCFRICNFSRTFSNHVWNATFF